MPTVRYRAYNPALQPRRTKLDVPGWAGSTDKREDGAWEQPWHCIPFTEAARAGLEVCYPHDTACHVTMRDGGLLFGDGITMVSGWDGAPFRDFGSDYYTYQLLLDLKVGPDWALKVETHPRYYTDRTGTVAAAVPAIIRHWWPMIYFVVFKSPLEGQTHIFRPGDPFLQVSLVQPDDKIDVVEMTAEEAAERELQSRRIYASRDTLSVDTRWTSSTDTVFDGTYRRIYGAAKSSKT